MLSHGASQSQLKTTSLQDALIDVVTGLGVPLRKIILNTPAFGNSFNLMEASVNLPGSATSGLPQTMTYQQVCRVLSTGNWTLERDEDLTGPYSFLGNKWISFDDDTSLKIKVGPVPAEWGTIHCLIAGQVLPVAGSGWCWSRQY